MNEIESGMLRSAIRTGMTNENQLADLIFFRRHPERNGRLISRTEPNFQQLSQEWLHIRDTLVRPVLRGATPVPWAPSTPTGPSPSSSGAAGMASSIFSVRFTHDPPPPAPDHSLPRPGPAGSGPGRAGYTTAPLKPHISIV